MADARAHPELIFGGAIVGVSYTTAESVKSLVSQLRTQGIASIDTAARYPPNDPGRSEELLGAAIGADDDDASIAIDTKILTRGPGGHGDLEPAASRASFSASLGRLKRTRVRTLYIHTPDLQTPVEKQAVGLQALYEAGGFERLGVSNMTAQQVEELDRACRDRGFVRPSVYQGEYNVMQRDAERDLLPVLRSRGIRFVAFRALAAGFLRASQDTGGTRFQEGHPLAAAMNSVYGGEGARSARELVMEACKGDGDVEPVDPIEAALRWACYSSALTPDDAVLLGASSERHIVSNVEAIRKGPLPQSVAAKLDRVWSVLQSEAQA